MTDRFIALGRSSCIEKLERMARTRGWLRLGPWPWHFLAGQTHGFSTPNGARVHLAEQTMYGAHVVTVTRDREGLADELTRALELTTLDALGRQWEAAKTSPEKVDVLLQLASAQAMADGKVLAEYALAIRNALDDADSVVRLTAIRMLAIAPSGYGQQMLQGRTDAENPGLVDWQELFAQNAETEG